MPNVQVKVIDTRGFEVACAALAKASGLPLQRVVQQAPSVPEWSQQFEDWPIDNEMDEYSYWDPAYMERPARWLQRLVDFAHKC